MGLSKEEQARLEGYAQAARYAKEHGAEALVEDARKRGILKMPLRVSQKDLNEFVENQKMTIFDTVLMMSVWVLHNLWPEQFGRVMKGREKRSRILQFREEFFHQADCMLGDYLNWEDVKVALAEEVNLPLEDIRYNDKDVRI